MSTFYTNIPLKSPRSIRLLSLSPSKDSQAALQCELIPADVDHLPPFEALSYAWDSDHGEPIPILCQERELLITENCGLALRRLRYSSKIRILWVDAICIDQNSEREKNCQVALMKNIYEGASLVIVWLGESTTESQTFFRELHTFSRYLLSKVIPIPVRLYLGRRRVKKIRGKWKPKSSVRSVWDPDILIQLPWMIDVLGRSWFSRVWTLQELALASDCVMVCGESSISWDRWWRTIICLEYYPDFNHIRGFISPHLSMWAGYKNVKQKTENDFKPSMVLAQSRVLSSTNPLDKVYGLYALFLGYGM